MAWGPECRAKPQGSILQSACPSVRHCPSWFIKGPLLISAFISGSKARGNRYLLGQGTANLLRAQHLLTDSIITLPQKSVVFSLPIR